jgi:hypothetical protein
MILSNDSNARNSITIFVQTDCGKLQNKTSIGIQLAVSSINSIRTVPSVMSFMQTGE